MGLEYNYVGLMLKNGSRIRLGPGLVVKALGPEIIEQAAWLYDKVINSAFRISFNSFLLKISSESDLIKTTKRTRGFITCRAWLAKISPRNHQ
jgi:hypothetical protein